MSAVSGLIRAYEDHRTQWQLVIEVAASKGVPAVEAQAVVDTWDAAIRLAEKWERALEGEQ